MNFKKITLSMAALSSVLILGTGCADKSVEPEKIYTPQQDQELQIFTAVELNKKKDDMVYTVNLDNDQHSHATVTLKNRGEKDLVIQSLKLIDMSGLLKFSTTCKAPLAAKETCKVHLDFKTSKAGKYTSYLEVISNDVKHKKAKIIINMSAKNHFHAQVSAISATENDLNIQRPVKLSFNANQRVRYVEITNDGIEKIKLNKPLKVGKDAKNFTYKTDCKSSLEVGESCKVAITYDPTKKDGFSDASMILPSNAKISPSNSIRLEGYSKPFSLSIKKFVVAKNIDNFVEDYFTSDKTYYVRIIYQNNVGRFLESGVRKEIKKYFAANHFKMVNSADKADKIITVYPSVKVTKNYQTNDVDYNIVVNGFATTKAQAHLSTNYKKVVKVFKPEKDAKFTFSALSLDEKVVPDFNSKQSGLKFTAITLNDTVFSKEQFQFGMLVHIDNIADEKDVELTVADLLVSKLFNTLGLKDTKGSN